MISSHKKFVVIDAMALAYKAYFAFIGRPLKNSKGEPTSAVFGFLSQVFKILEDTKPGYVAIAFDSKEKTFRHKLFPGYKASRLAMPEDLIPQIARIKEIIEAFNIPVYICPGYEADDIIGTVAKKAEAHGYDFYAITPDKDYNQIVTENVRVIKPGKSTDEILVIDKARILEDYGFEPIRMIDYLALVGDASDDIPGVAGIGPKTATPLIQAFGSVEDIYANLDKIEKASVRKKLEENKDNAFLSKVLATICTEVPVTIDFDSARMELPDFAKLNEIFTELNFRNFTMRLMKIYGNAEIQNNISEGATALPAGETAAEDAPGLSEPQKFDASKVSYRLVNSAEDARILADKLSYTSLFVFDTETDSLDCLSANIAGVSFCMQENEAYFVALNPFTQSDDLFARDLSDRIALPEFIKIFRGVFANAQINKVCQNGKFDIAVLRTIGIEVKSFYFDTMLASYVLDPDQKHNMDDLSLKYLNYEPIHFTEIIGTKKDPSCIFDAEIHTLSDYSCEDADVTYKLYKLFLNLVEQNGLTDLCKKVEFPLVEVLEDMERSGIKIDTSMLRALSKDLQILMDNYQLKIFELAGETFNINSPLQMQKILFGKLGLATGKKTKTGYSTDARTLENLRGSDEIIDIILDFRQASKLKSTYADALPELIHPKTGRLHTSFNQTIASTGRLTSNEPNLQNIPIRTDLGKEIRKAFIGRNKEYCILSADYSQIELRILAALCGDEALTRAFKNGEDIHRSTASLVFNVSPEEVTSDMRRKAKEVNFGILYGIGPFGLKTRLGVTQSHAKEIIDTYFSKFASVKNFMDECIQKAREKGYAETLTGRRRFLHNINSKNATLRQFEERVAINMPIQGTAADMIKLAMINIHKELLNRNTKTKMVLQVHDELVFDTFKGEIEELKPLIKELMEKALVLDVPIAAEIGVGENWLDAH